MMGYKEYSDSYLMTLKKKELISQLRIAEYNFRVTEQNLKNQKCGGLATCEAREVDKLFRYGDN